MSPAARSQAARRLVKRAIRLAEPDDRGEPRRGAIDALNESCRRDRADGRATDHDVLDLALVAVGHTAGALVTNYKARYANRAPGRVTEGVVRTHPGEAPARLRLALARMEIS